MDALSIAQAYAVFLLYSQGEKAAYPDNTQSGYILMAAFLELFFSGAIETDKKQRIRLHTPPGSKKYLQAIGEEIADGPPRTLGGWLEYYLSGFSDKDIHTVVCGLLDSLQEEGWLHPKGKGLFRTKYTLEPGKTQQAVEDFRIALLHGGRVGSQIQALALLLHQSGVLRALFSHEEEKKVQARLEDFQDHPMRRPIALIQKVLDHCDTEAAFLNWQMNEFY